jgi:hypothetical protein
MGCARGGPKSERYAHLCLTFDPSQYRLGIDFDRLDRDFAPSTEARALTPLTSHTSPHNTPSRPTVAWGAWGGGAAAGAGAALAAGVARILRRNRREHAAPRGRPRSATGLMTDPRTRNCNSSYSPANGPGCRLEMGT